MDKNKLKLIALLGIAIVPLSLATWAFNKAIEHGVGGTTNKGVLVTPVLDLAELGLRDAEGGPAYQGFEELTAGVSPDDYDPRPWQLLYLGTANCDAGCEDRLFFLRQMHILLAGDAPRVQRVYVQVGQGTQLDPGVAALLEREHPGMRAVFVDSATLGAELAPSAAGHDPVAEHYIYVADPVGNVMMYFTPGNTPEQILSDLEKLLKRSSLG
ncbi:MAG TPA: hypothetical protein VNR18_03250 [Hyphomicrobiales bacterium]|nr:hypothetical protein [Hyphomicrobiales bacterium]